VKLIGFRLDNHETETRKDTMASVTTAAIITALTNAWDRINTWLGRSQAEQAKAQDDEVQRMAKELEKRAKEQTNER